MVGKSNYNAEKQSRRGNRCLDGWRSGGREVGREEAVAPSTAATAAVTRHDSVRAEQSAVALSTFSSASKCQAMFARKHAHVGGRAVTLEESGEEGAL